MQEDIRLTLRPLRLLLVVDSLDVGGAEQHVVSLASALAQRGHHVTLACSAEGALAPLVRRAGIPVRSLDHHVVKRRLSPTFAWKLALLVRQGHFDLVHAHMYASAFASACATLGTATPLVLTEHSEANWRSQRACRCARWFYQRAKHVIAVSKEIRRRLIEQDGVPFDRVSVIMNAVPPVPALPTSRSLDLPAGLQNGPLVGVATRLQPEKGVAYFLEAAAHVIQVSPHIDFLVIGDGPLRHELQAYAKQLGIHKHVHFLGFRLDARALIGLLDILVIPSLSEGTPLVTLEAMAAGVPVVASAVGGIPEQIRHQYEGLLVQPGNSRALGEALLQLLQHPALMRRLGEAGRKRADSQFRFTTMVQETEAIYWTTLGWQVRSGTNREESNHPFAETGS